MARGRPKTTTFMRLGKVAVQRVDSLNWAVEDGQSVRYYYHLPSAIKRAAEVAVEAKARDAHEWLVEYDKLTKKLEGVIAAALKDHQEAREQGEETE